MENPTERNGTLGLTLASVILRRTSGQIGIRSRTAVVVSRRAAARVLRDTGRQIRVRRGTARVVLCLAVGGCHSTGGKGHGKEGSEADHRTNVLTMR